MVLLLRRIAVIESCQGVIADPGSGDKWRFALSKRDNQILFETLTPEVAESNLSSEPHQ